MVKPQGPGPGEGAGGLGDNPMSRPTSGQSAPGCLRCLMQGPPAEPLGSRPGPVLGEILNFLELSSLLCKMGKVTAPTPVPSPRTAEQGEALRPNSWVRTLEPAPTSCVPLEKLLNFSEAPCPPCKIVLTPRSV